MYLVKSIFSQVDITTQSTQKNTYTAYTQY